MEVLSLYERAIAGCRQRDAEAVDAVLTELIDALDFDYERAALALFRMYDGCRRRIGGGEFDVVRQRLESLRAACEPTPVADALSARR